MLSKPEETALAWTIRNARKALPKVPELPLIGSGIKAVCAQIRRIPVLELLAAALRERTAIATACVIGYSVGPYRLDVGFRDVLLGVEIRSGDWCHADFGIMHGAVKREQYLARMGWTLLRFGEKEVARRPKASVEKIERIYWLLEA